MSKRTFFIGFLLLTLAIVFNFNETSAQNRVDVRGSVSSIIPPEKKSGKTPGTIFVEGVKESDTQTDKAYLLVTNKTRIFLQEGNKRRRASFGDIRKGDKVDARFADGVMIAIYPARAVAAEIVILRQ